MLCKEFQRMLAFSVWTLGSLSFQPLSANSSDYSPSFETGTRNDATIKLCQNIIDKNPRPQNAKASSSTSELPYFNWRGNVGMLGLKYKMGGHGFPEVQTIFPGTPSQKAQLHIGDKIRFIDDVPTDKLTTEDITGLLVGGQGTRVALTID